MMMSPSQAPLLETLLDRTLGEARAERLFRLLHVHPQLVEARGPLVSRAVMAQALNMVLFEDLVARVPAAAAYVADRLAAGEKVMHDHGAVRTVTLAGMGALPSGEEALVRVLRPLGYRQNGLYPLDRLKMTGRSYAQIDFPEEIAQFFVSELHPERFSAEFQATVARVAGTSRDPLTPHAAAILAKLEEAGRIPFDEAAEVLPILAHCFDRQHAVPSLADYEILLAESAEMAWISTEGNAFNHATDRVADVEALSEAQKTLGRPMKPAVEISQSGRVKQTAFRAATVRRSFRTEDGLIEKDVPGSFYEFITRLPVPEASGETRLDLGFDSSNAQGIFKMTAAA
jgi:hypothetical protein